MGHPESTSKAPCRRKRDKDEAPTACLWLDDLDIMRELWLLGDALWG